MPQHITQEDHQFLMAMQSIHEDAVRLARAYLGATDPETRLANVTDIARGMITGHGETIDKIQAILDPATPPNRDDDVEGLRVM